MQKIAGYLDWSVSGGEIGNMKMSDGQKHYFTSSLVFEVSGKVVGLGGTGSSNFEFPPRLGMLGDLATEPEEQGYIGQN